MKPLNMSESRFNILLTLRKGNYSVGELSSILGMSSTGVRQHLTILEREALIKKVSIKGETGRPKYVYSLTEEAEIFFPKAYHKLATWLIEELNSRNMCLEEIITNIAKRNAMKYKEKFIGKSLREKINILLEILNSNGEIAEIVDDTKIKKYNCLFSHLIPHFNNTICRYDEVFCSELLGKNVRITKINNERERFCLIETL